MALKSVYTNASGHFIVPPPGSCITGLQHDITVYYSFDFAQQVMTNCALKLCSKKSSESITANLVFTVTQLTFEESCSYYISVQQRLVSKNYRNGNTITFNCQTLKCFECFLLCMVYITESSHNIRNNSFITCTFRYIILVIHSNLNQPHTLEMRAFRCVL